MTISITINCSFLIWSVILCLLLAESMDLESCKFIMDFRFNLANDYKIHNQINSMHIWKTNQVHVKCKKILAYGGGGDVFHVKPLLGEGMRKKKISFSKQRERDLVWKRNQYIIAKKLIFKRGIWCG